MHIDHEIYELPILAGYCPALNSTKVEWIETEIVCLNSKTYFDYNDQDDNKNCYERL